MQKLVSKEKKAIIDAKKKEREEQADKLYFRLHDLGKKIPVTIYGNSERLVKMLTLIKSIKDVLDTYYSKRIATLSPKDLEKLNNLHKEVVELNKEIQKNNYEQFKVIEIYMNDFLTQIEFINASIKAMSKLNKDITKHAESIESSSPLKSLQDQLESIRKSLSEKYNLRKDIFDEIKQLEIKRLSLTKTIQDNQEIIESNKVINIASDDENEIIKKTQKELNELEEIYEKKQKDYLKYDDEYNELFNTQSDLVSKIENLSTKKGGRKTRKKRNKKMN
jgi:hypothetical protein